MFLDHMTPKTIFKVIQITLINYFIKIKTITVFTAFFYEINAALVNILGNRLISKALKKSQLSQMFDWWCKFANSDKRFYKCIFVLPQ